MRIEPIRGRRLNPDSEPPVTRNRVVIDTTITGAMFLNLQYGFLLRSSAATAKMIERILSAVAPYAPSRRYWIATADDISTDRIVMVLLLLLYEIATSSTEAISPKMNASNLEVSLLSTLFRYLS